MFECLKRSNENPRLNGNGFIFLLIFSSRFEKKRNILRNSVPRLDLISSFNGIPIFVGYLMQKLSLMKNSCDTIQSITVE